MKKKITFGLMITLLTFSCLPAEAGYYKTIYVEDEKPNIVINNIQPTETVVVEKNNYIPSYDTAATALGITALVGGVILGVASHNHYKKHHQKHHTPPKPSHKNKPHPPRKR
ncbi:MAG: hypothetical protein J6V53_01990 [Alphaproteobacteria bacterium]|nr:hypothetical protein [Alphaproteobacteria bacterium]